MDDDLLYVLRPPCAQCNHGRVREDELLAYHCTSTGRCEWPDEARRLSIMAGEIADGIMQEGGYRLREKISDGVAEVLDRAMEDIGAVFDREMFRWSCEVHEI